VRKVSPHTSGMSVPGTRYEVHNIGISLMMIPGFSILGYKGAIGTFAVLSALLVANIFLLTADITGRRRLSFAVAAIVGCSAPFIFYFRYIYPEIPAALCLVYAVRILIINRPSSVSLLLAGSAAAIMPWFHAKFVLMSAILAGLFLWKHRRSIRSMAFYLIPHFPIALLLMVFFYQAYGSWMPNAQYGGAYDTVSSFFFRGAPGIFLDRDHGLLAFAPFFWLVLPGLPLLYKQNRVYFFSTLILTVPSFVIFTSHWMWWGGPCPAARFLIPIIPLFIPAIALALMYISSTVFRLLAGASIISTLILSYYSIGYLATLPFHQHYLRWLIPSYDAFPFFPLFFIHRTQEVPIENFTVAGIWFLLWLSTLIFVFRGNSNEYFSHTIQKASAKSILIAGTLFLFVPGAVGIVNAKLSGQDTDHPSGSHRPFAHMNVVLEAYSSPFFRAGVPVESVNDRMRPYVINSEYNINVQRSFSQEHFHPNSRNWVFFGKYFTLYPAEYNLTINGMVEAEGTGDVLLIDLCSDRGRNIIFNKIIDQSQINEGELSYSYTTVISNIEHGSEFRAIALAPGNYSLYNVAIKAYISGKKME
jgi:hypothetical protein